MAKEKLTAVKVRNLEPGMHHGGGARPSCDPLVVTQIATPIRNQSSKYRLGLGIFATADRWRPEVRVGCRYPDPKSPINPLASGELTPWPVCPELRPRPE